MEPSAAELLEFTTVGMIMTWIGIDDVNRATMHNIMGTTDASHPRTVAGIPPDAFDAAFLNMQITVVPLLPRALTLAERSHIGILRETCCLAAGTKKTSAVLRAEAETEARNASELAAEAAKRNVETSLVPVTASKRVKLDTVFNRHDKSVITMIPRSELDHCYAIPSKDITGAAGTTPEGRSAEDSPAAEAAAGSEDESSSIDSEPCDYLVALAEAERRARVKGNIERAEECARIAAKVRRSRAAAGETFEPDPSSRSEIAGR